MPFFECERLYDSRARGRGGGSGKTRQLPFFFFFLCKEQRVVGVRHQPLTLCHLIQTH